VAANEKDLGAVHAAMTEWALEALSARDPESGRRLLTAGEAAVIRAFLKDNDIQAPPEANKGLDELRRKLQSQGRGPKVDPVLDLSDGFMQ
jgi:hypothetical protein